MKNKTILSLLLIVLITIALIFTIRRYGKLIKGETASIQIIKILNIDGPDVETTEESYIRIVHVPNSKRDHIKFYFNIKILENSPDFQMRILTFNRLHIKEKVEYAHSFEIKQWKREGKFFTDLFFDNPIKAGDQMTFSADFEGNIAREIEEKFIVNLHVESQLKPINNVIPVVFFGGEQVIYDYFHPDPKNLHGDPENPNMLEFLIENGKINNGFREVVSIVGSNIFKNNIFRRIEFRFGVSIAILTSLLASVLFSLIFKE